MQNADSPDIMWETERLIYIYIYIYIYILNALNFDMKNDKALFTFVLKQYLCKRSPF